MRVGWAGGDANGLVRVIFLKIINMQNIQIHQKFNGLDLF
jgi:hypothetical protein